MDVPEACFLYTGVRMMQRERTDLLYALSTLAQTCAALTAFIGALGLYLLQALNNRHRSLYRDISATQGNPTMPSDALLEQARTGPDSKLTALLEKYDAMGWVIARFRQDFVMYEGVSLLVVLLSLLGLASMEWLMRWPLTRIGVVACSMVAIGATVKMIVMMWQRADDQRMEI